MQGYLSLTPPRTPSVAASCKVKDLRILFAFDPWRSAILLTGGDKSRDWQGWYRGAITRAEQLYEQYLKERKAEESQ